MKSRVSFFVLIIKIELKEKMQEFENKLDELKKLKKKAKKMSIEPISEKIINERKQIQSKKYRPRPANQSQRIRIGNDKLENRPRRQLEIRAGHV